MKRILVAMTSLVIAVLMCVTCLTGCNLVTVDNERDMNQLVATVQIDPEAKKEEIYKKDMIISYLNYYYMYEQQGQSRDAIFKMIIDNLITNRVYVQNAMKAFDEGKEPFNNGVVDSAKNKWDIERYLSAEDKNDSIYSAYKDMNNLIDSYETEKKDNKLGDTMVEEVRAVPAGAKNDDEVTEAEKTEYIEKGIDTNSTEERRKAFNKVIDVLEKNDLLGDDYDGSDIKKTEFYKDTLTNYYESHLITKYNKCITDAARSKVTFAMLEAEYVEKYEEQKAWDSKQFATALDGISSTAPILYCGFDGYGLAYNLLLGIDDEIKTELDDWKKDNKNFDKATYAAFRKTAFEKITAKDLRSTWILSGYDFDGTKFTGDYTLTSPENSLKFMGTSKLLNEADKNNKDYKAEYGSVIPDVFDLDGFINMMETYIYGAPQSPVASSNPSVLRKVNSATALPEYDERVKELLFAFSTDPGSLTSYKGYAITPTPDAADKEKFMEEFIDAGRELIDMDKNSYIIIATDYGYHIMFFSAKFVNGTGYDTLTAFLNAEYGEEDWNKFYNDMMADWEDFKETDHYLYNLQNTLSQASVQKALEDNRLDILNKYVYEGDYVVKYESAYADLIKK